MEFPMLMKSDGFFSIVDEIGRHPVLPVRRPAVFPNTGNLRLTQVDRPWARWSGGALGPSGIELWKVETTGHHIDLVSAQKWSYHLPLSGRMALTYPQMDHDLRTFRGALLNPDARTTHTIAPASGIFESAVVLIPPQLLADDLDDTPLHASGPITPDDRRLRDFVTYLFQALSHPESPLASEHARASAGTMIAEFYRAALVRHAELGPERSAGAQRVAQAEEIMRRGFQVSLAMADVARELGVSLRALQAAFREHRGKSPREVLVAIRLEEARRRLLAAVDDGTSVTDVALSSGFSHLGRFATTYRRAYGEAPSDTLRRRR
jgi:AraC-like DNA-binding protein